MKKLISLCVSITILAAIYWKVDVAGVVRTLGDSHGGMLTAGLLLVVPLTALTAGRLLLLLPRSAAMSSGDALSLTLSASVLNMVMPSKMGDIAKAYFMTEQGRIRAALAFSTVIFEKGWDLLSLLVWCLLGLLMVRGGDPIYSVAGGFIAAGIVTGALIMGSSRMATSIVQTVARSVPERAAEKLRAMEAAWAEVLTAFWQRRARALAVVGLSGALWFLHLLQIWIFILALGAHVPLHAALGIAPLAILAGLLPFTFAGVGTRDAALILLFRDYLTAPQGAALGLLCTLRYVLPAVAGVPFFSEHLDRVRRMKWRSSEHSYE